MEQQATLQKGAFVISIDTELAWGMVHRRGVEENAYAYARTREAVGALLRLMERYEIRATWAVVGHLMLESCSPVNGVKHPEVPRPSYSWFEGDWFDQDPATDRAKDPFWYGPEIVDMISGCKVPQEIGCHTFSHMLVGDPGYSAETMRADLSLCRQLARARGLDLKSFVYPRNLVGHLNVLEEFGYESYRGPAPCWYDRMSGWPWRIAHKVDNFLPVAPPIVFPSRRGGLWDIPASYYYPHSTPRLGDWGRWLPVWTRVAKSRRALRKAAAQRGVFHIWFHPFNIAADMPRLLRGLEGIFTGVSRLRDKGVLDNLTMGDVVAQLELAPGRAPVTATGTAVAHDASTRTH
jgi:peptidoglycan/xylan/chitin deacetylase (PgdA/CDA1 family)